VLEAARETLLASAHDCSDGGLAVALVECCLGSHTAGASGGSAVGADLDLSPLTAGIDQGEGLAGLPLGRRSRPSLPIEALLFGEAPSRIVVSCRAEQVDRVLAIATRHGAPAQLLGRTVPEPSFRLDAGAHRIALSLDRLATAYGTGFQRAVLDR
jgi:phosphoribosylformylglycinamidine synthase